MRVSKTNFQQISTELVRSVNGEVGEREGEWASVGRVTLCMNIFVMWRHSKLRGTVTGGVQCVCGLRFGALFSAV